MNAGGIAKGVSLDELLASRAPMRLRDVDFTDIHLSGLGTVRVRGVLQGVERSVLVPTEVFSDCSEMSRRVLQQGAGEDEFPLDFDGVRYRVSKIPSDGGTWFALRRLIDPVPRLNEIKLPLSIVHEIAFVAQNERKGLILISGPTGSGKTTTASSIIQEYLTCYGGIGVTVEDPPELKLEGQHGEWGHCFQITVKDGDFAAALRASLRWRPNYILLGEIRDAAAANQAVRIAKTGHVVIATIHAGSIQETLESMITYTTGLDPRGARGTLAQSLAGVIHQSMHAKRAPPNGYRRRIIAQALFFDGQDGLRAKIRDGHIEQIGTEIAQQMQRVENQQPAILRQHREVREAGRR